ncbi:serine hydrolase [Gemmata sp.]|uniref:serine hydrolase n=1 Tax=Gemmata sp. TaxID=1914242 RepID=UPI003F709723
MRFVSLVAVLFVAPAACAQPAVPAAEPYKAAVAELEALVRREVDDKKLPAVSVALVDDQKVVWAAGFGFADRGKKTPATAETVYRVGSVSKLFTDVAVMQLVEDGKLDLDAPVAKYVPDFKPAYRDGQKEVTLRMLMAHRSGLVREPPVGNYFDPTEPSLEKSVASLNGIAPVYDPGSRTKYSNAAVGLVGYVLQKSQGEKFETHVQRRVLDPLGMASSSFVATPAVKKHLADALMWTYHGREFPARRSNSVSPRPGACTRPYSTVLDLAKFQSCLFAGGKVGGKQLLKPETIAEMFRPQFAKDGQRGFGLGFIVGDLDGRKRVGHGGAIYGFATEFALLPAEKLGVVVVASRDVSNAVTTRIADDALRLMLAAKAGKPLPKLDAPERLAPQEIAALVGRYRGGERHLDLTESFGRLFVQSDRGGPVVQLRKLGKELVVDDVQGWGTRIVAEGDTLTLGKAAYTKEKPRTDAPPEVPAKWRGLIGEYGWDHNTLYVYERDGKLHALIEWTEVDPLTEESDDVFAFPADRGMYHGEKLVFTRDKTGRATKVTAASVVFERRKIDGEGGETFQIKPIKPLDDLRKLALAATPPEEKGEFLKPDLVDLATIDGVKFDIRYATDNNFLGKPFYSSAKAFMQKPAAAALARVQAAVKQRGYGLIVYDAYRPWYVTKMFWDATPEKLHNFVADPSQGSRHNRGCAVDLGLYDRKTGKVVEMVSGYDEMTDRAFPDYPGTTSRQRWHRDLLLRAMAAEGFSVYEEEWWHYDYKDWRKYPILNKTFEELAGK